MHAFLIALKEFILQKRYHFLYRKRCKGCIDVQKGSASPRVFKGCFSKRRSLIYLKNIIANVKANLARNIYQQRANPVLLDFFPDLSVIPLPPTPTQSSLRTKRTKQIHTHRSGWSTFSAFAGPTVASARAAAGGCMHA